MIATATRNAGWLRSPPSAAVAAVLNKMSPSAPASTCPKPTRQLFVREPVAVQPAGHKKGVFMSMEEAMEKFIKSGHKVYAQGMSGTPAALLKGMTAHAKSKQLRDIQLYLTLPLGPAPYAEEDCKGIIRANCLFVGASTRKAVNEGRADFVPIFLSDIALLFRRRAIEFDVALIQVTTPDNQGYVSLGMGVDCNRPALENAKAVVAQVNINMPRTFGDGTIHISNIDALVEAHDPLPELKSREINEVDAKIGHLIATELVEDGATLQMGIGAIPDAVLDDLKNHKHLGIHTEMFSDGVIDLIQTGCVTNHLKTLERGKTVTAFAYGSRKLYDFVNENPSIVFRDVEYTNMSSMIARNPKVTAINSCIEVDLTGQVVSDSIGTKIYSGFGGQVDFLRGAAVGRDGKGKPILALQSVTNKGNSKIVPMLQAGAGVVTTRAHVHYVVTEHGVAYLWGKNLRQRAYELIRIAHPDHRERLEKAAYQRLRVMPSP